MNDRDNRPGAAFLAQFSLNSAQDASVRCAERFSTYLALGRSSRRATPPRARGGD